MSTRKFYLTLVVCVLVIAAPASAGIVAWYSLDDGTAGDVTGNGNDGRVGGRPRPIEGISGSAFDFNGLRDQVVAQITSGFAAPEIAVSAFIRIDEVPVGKAGLMQVVLGDTTFRLGLDSRGNVFFELGSGGDRSEIRSTFAVQPGVWTSIIGSYDGAEALLYVHGELAASSSLPGFVVGSEGRLAFGQGIAVQVDEIKLGDSVVSLSTACSLALKAWDSASQTCNLTVTDVSVELGFLSPEHQHFGATLVDVDRDGWLDYYVINGGSNPDVPETETGVCPPFDGIPDHLESAVNQFYLNNGDGTFGLDTAEALGLDDFWNAMRHVWGDYDGDGDFDVYSHNFVLSSLYEMVSGPSPMVFEDVSEAANLRVCLRRGTGASWVDVDADGDLDILLVEYEPGRPAAEHLVVLHLNNGDGTFTDVTDDSGFAADASNGMGIAFGDYDNDGDQDVFITNSHEVPSRLYRNEGIDPDTGVPFFIDVGAAAGVAVIGEPNRGVGATWGDYDNDGWLDLLFSREADSRLFRNLGDGTFEDVSNVGGLDFAPPNSRFWGGGFADLDNDGWLDIVLTNREFEIGGGGPNLMYLNNRDGSWREVGGLLGIQTPSDTGLGFVPGDIDNDGDLDFVIVSHEIEQSNHFYRNEERGNNWIQIRLHGTRSNLDGVGARIAVQARLEAGEGPVTQIREVTAGNGFFSDYPRIQTFGLGKAPSVSRVRITWPSGVVQNLTDLEINMRHDIEEPMP